MVKGDDGRDIDEESISGNYHDMKGAEIQGDNLKRKRQHEEEEDDNEIVFKPKRYKRVLLKGRQLWKAIVARRDSVLSRDIM